MSQNSDPRVSLHQRKHTVLVDGDSVTLTREEAIACAVEKVYSGQWGLRQAANNVGVPPSTISDHLRLHRLEQEEKSTQVGPNGVSCVEGRRRGPGRPRVLSDELEEILVETVDEAISQQRPFATVADMCDFIQSILNESRIEVPAFRNNRPGKDWCKGFMDRNRFEVGSTKNQPIHRALVPLRSRDEFFQAFAEELKRVGG